ncbi:G-D-S-L family lipolytic protein [Flavobacterium selenitireducens]|uniref:G-D-S-L family lipolytic protein n=1 Tax=Flavobacterium selenitireducens TaxID=2722704 RepID=UPI00168B0244|nr:G-D-S-L family lipolytic protein [Flavobacterium selenitireducens]MBD3581788.1 G-D-S-L family lipolytic protein [Flavobacterium selenitireducens]
MIRNFKYVLLASLTFAACSDDDNGSSAADEPITAGSADLSKYVALGDSFAAGYSDNALFRKGQENSYPNIIASQFALAGGGAFTQPLMVDNIGGFSMGGVQIPQFPTRLYLGLPNPNVPSPSPMNVPGVSGTVFGTTVNGPVSNLGIPGAKSFHLTVPGYGQLNPYFGRFASSPTASVLGDALSQNPTFFSLWIGGNDVLGYATNGGVPTSQDPVNGNDITPPATFEAVYSGMVAQLAEGGRKGVIANLPYINTLPFFTTVPYNPLTTSVLGAGNVAVGEATVDALNAQLYGPLKQALTAFGAGDRINLLSKTQGNPLLIKDESLPDLSAQLTAAFTPSLGIATATFYGQVFGQARHAKAGTARDFVLLTTRAVIGSAPAGIPAPLNKFGITYPLQDKHVLVPSEVTEIAAATDAYNVTIANAAETHGLAFVDTFAIMNQLLNGGIRFGNYHLTATFATGGAFSLDGIHPSARGYGLIANKFLEAINTTYGSNFKGVDLGTYPIQYPMNLP